MPKTVTFDGEHLTPEQIPVPATWKIILAPIKVEDTTDGGIIITQETQKLQESVRFIGKVLAMGPLCYSQDRFKVHPNANPEVPCKPGDIVITGQYSGIKVPCVDGAGGMFDLRVVNDDEIVAVVNDVTVLNAQEITHGD